MNLHRTSRLVGNQYYTEQAVKYSRRRLGKCLGDFLQLNKPEFINKKSTLVGVILTSLF